MEGRDHASRLTELNAGWLRQMPWCVHAQPVGCSPRPALVLDSNTPARQHRQGERQVRNHLTHDNLIIAFVASESKANPENRCQSVIASNSSTHSEDHATPWPCSPYVICTRNLSVTSVHATAPDGRDALCYIWHQLLCSAKRKDAAISDTVTSSPSSFACGSTGPGSLCMIRQERADSRAGSPLPV